ncbi:MAG TPA: nucleoside hydrolase [Pyrinomonadaceae bacterium]|nr:nucleoside hydrolase [Pyrinomonadaceae bacterium]
MDVIQIHDAAIDEYMSTVLLTTMEDVNLLGIVIVNADSIAAPAMQTAWKILRYIKRTDIPVGLSGARGVNPFPWSYRSDCVSEGKIGVLAPFKDNPKWPPFPDGDALLRELLQKAEGPVTLLVTSPMTPLSDLLRASPGLEEKIEQVVWMGGAIKVAGNLDPTTVPTPPCNKCAEWNAFWDPMAVDWVFRNTSFPLTVFPLDITNQASITTAFLTSLANQSGKAPLSALAFESYLLVGSEVFYDMWDVVTTCYLTRPDLFKKPTRMQLAIDTAFDDEQGCIKGKKKGRESSVVFNFSDDGSAFYSYVLEQFNR